MEHTEGTRQLRVWWIPQVPGKPFTAEVATVAEGRLLLDVLAAYDLFQLANRIKPDYSNAGGLHEWNAETGEWEDFYDEDGDDAGDDKYARTVMGKRPGYAITLLREETTA